MVEGVRSSSGWMRRRGARGVGALAALVVLLAPARAQGVRAFETLDQGLPSVRALQGVQLDDGRVAFATDVGLAMYDGRAWDVDGRVLELLPQPRLLAQDEDGALWAAGFDGRRGLAHLSDRVWRAVSTPAELPQGGEDLAHLPLHLQVTGSGPTQRVLFATGFEALERTGDTWTRLADREELGGVLRSVVRFDGAVVLGSEGGLAVWREGRLETWPLPEGVAHPQVLSLTVEEGALPRLWILGADWKAHAVAAGGALEVVPHPALDLEAEHRMLPDGAGGLWIGALSGLWHTSDEGLRQIRRDSHIETWQGVNGLLRDREGVLWIAHARGVHRVPSARFEVWRRMDGLLQDDVTAIIESPPGRLVLAHPDGLSFLGPGQLRTRRLQSNVLAPSRTLSIAADEGGTIWIARERDGVLRMAPDGTVERLELPPRAFVTSVLVDSRQQVWLTTFSDLFRWAGERFEVVDEPLLRVSPRRVLELADGRLAVATTSGGVALLEGGRWHRLEHPDGGLFNSVYDVHQREDGTLLVASDAGLLAERDGRLEPWSDSGIELTEPTYALLEADDELWVGTRDGVVRWDGARIRRYGHAQGLASREINRAGLLQDSRGRVWIGGVGGASRYHPEFDRTDLPAPRLALEAVVQGGRSYEPDRPLRLAHDEADVDFLFHGISFADVGGVDYRFRLHGHDEDWIEDRRASGGGLVRYTSLPAGEYRFEVAARVGEGPWSPSVSSGALEITAAFWSTGWFHALVIVLLGAIGWGANHLLVQRRRNLRLDALVRERTEELVAAERGYREVFEESRAPQLLVDAGDGTISAANPAAEAFFGRTAGELVGASFSSFVVPGEDDEPLDLTGLEVGQGRRFECAVRGAGDEVREVELYASSHELRGRATVQALLHDVTEQRRLQVKLADTQRMESLGMLAGGVAHDFNNLLTVILGNTELALADVDPDEPQAAELAHDLEQIRESARRGAGLTRQLLEFSRRRVVRSEPLDLNAIVRDLEPLARRLMRADIRLELELERGLAPILAERSQVEQVVLNLVANAGEAMPDGGTTTIRTAQVELRAGELGTPAGLSGPFARLEVSDTGVGMDAATAARVFEPFFSSKPMGSGTGLGLATLHGIVEQSGGRVEVESAPGAGSTFRVWLPLASEPAGAVAQESAGAPARGSETILLCEDDEALRVLTTRLLSAGGYEVLAAATAGVALALARDASRAIDLLLTDVILPESNGRELAEEVSALRPGLPVLFVSGYTADVIARHGVLGPGTELLHKPFHGPELLERVRTLLDRAAKGAHAGGRA